MKIATSFVFAVLLIATSAEAAAAVTGERTWAESWAVQTESPSVRIDNIWGNVIVRTGVAGQVSVSAVELRSAPDQERFDRSFVVLKPDINADADGVSIVVGNRDERSHQPQDCDGCRLDIQFEITVPPASIIDVSTVMDGHVAVEGVTGSVTAANVNGSVRVENIEHCDSIKNVNGKIDVSFSHSPAQACKIGTVNGDITLGLPPGAGLDLALDLFNGEAVSELPAGPMNLPATVEHRIENGRNRYHIEKLSGLRIGDGGPTYSISSINGDVRIKKYW